MFLTVIYILFSSKGNSTGPGVVPADHTIMIAASCAVAVVVIGVPLLLGTCRKKRQAGKNTREIKFVTI